MSGWDVQGWVVFGLNLIEMCPVIPVMTRNMKINKSNFSTCRKYGLFRKSKTYTKTIPANISMTNNFHKISMEKCTTLHMVVNSWFVEID